MSHAASRRTNDLRALHLLKRDQWQVLRSLLDVSGLRIVNQLPGNHVHSIWSIQNRRCSEWATIGDIFDAIRVFGIGRNGDALADGVQFQDDIELNRLTSRQR